MCFQHRDPPPYPFGPSGGGRQDDVDSIVMQVRSKPAFTNMVSNMGPVPVEISNQVVATSNRRTPPPAYPDTTPPQTPSMNQEAPTQFRGQVKMRRQQGKKPPMNDYQKVFYIFRLIF